MLGQTTISSFTENRSWFELESALDEISEVCCQKNPEIEKVRDEIADEFMNTCCDSNCFLLHRKMSGYGCCSHARKAMKYIEYNLIRMIKQKSTDVNFFRLSSDDLFSYLIGDLLNMENEEDVVGVINSWIDIEPQKREKSRYSLMKSVRAAGLHPINFTKFENFELSTKSRRNYRDALLLLGGWSNKPEDEIEIFDWKNSTWQRSNLRLPKGMSYHAAVTVDEALYVFGGSDGYSFLCGMWKISPPLFQWEKCDMMLEARNYITNSCVAYDGKIYVFGGKDGRAMRGTEARSATAECYDTKLDKWDTISRMRERRSDCAAAVLGNLIYICGGFNGEHFLSCVEVYNPQADFYVPLQSLPVALSGHCMVTHLGQLCVLGGFDTVTRLNRIFIWNGHNKWVEQNEKLKIGRSTTSAASFRNCVIIGGGFVNSVDCSTECVLASNSPITLPIGDLIRRKSAAKMIVMPNWADYMDSIGIMPRSRVLISPMTQRLNEEEYMDEN